MYYGGESGEGRFFTDPPQGWQITVYDAEFTTPRWFRESIVYHIFPDRFCRGRQEGNGVSYHRSLGREIRIHDKWDEQPYYLPEEGRDHYVPNDFFLGDLKGLRDKLGYLQSLRIGCLYLNPVFESGSNHRYDTADYRKIDPILGTNAEFEELAAEFSLNGINVLLDGVFSHTGADSLYFNKYGRYPSKGAYGNEASPYRGWYDFSPAYAAGYRAWWGFPELPEVNETEESYLGFVFGKEDSLLRYWGGHGVKGWRLDVADELPDAFIKSMRSSLKKFDPDSVLLGEVWEDASSKEAYGVRREYVLGRELDSIMNYPFRKAVLAFFLGQMDAYALHEEMERLRERYPKPIYYALMNLLTSHDTVRALTVLGGAPDRDALSREQQAQYQPTEKMAALGKQRFLAAAALQFSMPGVPSIYYGDEAGAAGMADPFNRGTYPWGREDEEILQVFQALCAIRTDVDALRAGFCRMAALSQEVFAVLRYTNNRMDAFSAPAIDSAAICLANRSTHPVYVRLRPGDFLQGPDAQIPFDFYGTYASPLSGMRADCRNGELELVLPPVSGNVFVRAED